MTQHRRRALAATTAMIGALVRYQLTIIPIAGAEIARWRTRAECIPEPALRHLALDTIAQEASNAEAAAVFALLAPRATRRAAVQLLVPWQLMYDYLDTITEVPGPDPLQASLRAHRALTVSIDPGLSLDAIAAEDGGYLRELATICRDRLWRLPAAASIASAAAREATRCALAQSHTHAAMLTGDNESLRAWAQNDCRRAELEWWETAAAGISSLTVLALLALAADPTTTSADAAGVARAYAAVCSLSTLLDSLVDFVDDKASGKISYFAEYPDANAAAEGMRRIARRSNTAAMRLRRASLHETIVAGLAGFYLAKLPSDALEGQRIAADAVKDALSPAVEPALRVLQLRERARR